MPGLVDDIGSFPLPPSADKSAFERAYESARDAIAEGGNIEDDEFIMNNFYRVVLDSFIKKCSTGLQIVNYPQHYDMHKQFSHAIHQAMEDGTYVVDRKSSIIPEVYVIGRESRGLYERVGRKISLRVCITGPLELYAKEIGQTVYNDVLFMFADTTRVFAENSILNTKYIKTEAVALDEPSLGLHDMNIDRDTVIKALERAFDFHGTSKHIHIHSGVRIHDLLDVKNLDVLSVESARSPKNIQYISKRLLEQKDKQIRIGVSRTDIDSMMAELHDKGKTITDVEQIIESEDLIRRRFLSATEKFGESLGFVGPDCGLGGWPTQKAATQLLSRTVKAVELAKTET